MLKIFKNKDLKMSKLLDLWTKLCTLTTYFQNIKEQKTTILHATLNSICYCVTYPLHLERFFFQQKFPRMSHRMVASCQQTRK